MANTGWHETSPGVMLWVSASEAAIASTEQTLSHLTFRGEEIQDRLNSSYDRDERKVILPSVEDAFESPVKKDPEGYHFLQSSSSSCTASGHSDENALTPGSSHMSIPASPKEYLFLEQLNAYARSSNKGSPVPSAKLLTLHSDNASPDTNTDYDSDGTDFLLTRKTPCPSQGPSALSRQTGLKTHYWQKETSMKTVKPVRRTLDFGSSVFQGRVAKRPRQQKSTKMVLPEYSPMHRWTDPEREFLCVMWRFYARAPVDFAKIFNSAFDLDLSMSKVRDQMENHIRLHGEKAFKVYKDVQSVPFHDPEGTYDELCNIIEVTARDLDVKLHKLEEEATSPSGRAAKATSRLTRKCYKSLVRKNLQQEKAKAARLPAVEKRSTHVQSLGGIPLATNLTRDDDEFLTDVEDFPVLSVEYSRGATRAQNIAFRVWDENSKTIFSEDAGFKSAAFSSWRGELLEPFTPEGQGKQALTLLTNQHFSMTGGASAFVSVSISLLQAMVKASSMQNPRIAVIALDHELLKEPNKTLHAAEILRMLKSEGQAWWARYKGHAERIIWANVPRAAILHHCSLAELRLLSDRDQTCAHILNLEEFEFQPGRRTMTVASHLREKNIVLSTVTARAMGAIAKTFGMNSGNVKLAHIQDFVSALVDSWSISNTLAQDIHTSSSIASVFATSLGSRVHLIQDVMASFNKGMQQGADTLAYYSRRRSSLRRT